MSRKYPPWMEPVTLRGNEVLEDYKRWLREGLSDNEDQLDRVKKNTLRAMDEELTEKQKDVLKQMFLHGKTVTEIAIERGVNKSTVSRTKARAIRRLKRCLKYSF